MDDKSWTTPQSHFKILWFLVECMTFITAFYRNRSFNLITLITSHPPGKPLTWSKPSLWSKRPLACSKLINTFIEKRLLDYWKIESWLWFLITDTGVMCGAGQVERRNSLRATILQETITIGWKTTYIQTHGCIFFKLLRMQCNNPVINTGVKRGPCRVFGKLSQHHGRRCLCYSQMVLAIMSTMWYWPSCQQW